LNMDSAQDSCVHYSEGQNADFSPNQLCDPSSMSNHAI
jgi:hypothetical protein